MFRDDFDRTDFCNRLGKTIARFEWVLHAFVLMTTHYHFLLDVTVNTLSRGMKWLNELYAQTFNNRHGRRGHVFGGLSPHVHRERSAARGSLQIQTP